MDRSDDVAAEVVRVHIRLDSVIASPARARSFMSEILSAIPGSDRTGSDGNKTIYLPETLRDTAVLLVSELVTNAVLHAHTGVEVIVTTYPKTPCGRCVRVEVHDTDSTNLPQPRRPHITDETGRGLALVEALSQRWGVSPTASGKSVWFELCVPSA